MDAASRWIAYAIRCYLGAVANTLKSEVTYTLAAGASLALPHNLQLNDTSFEPDIISFDDPNFDYVSSTSTTVTIINNGLALASCTILCELWHTIERVFGSNAQNLAVKPFINRGSGGGGGGASTTQVFTVIATGAEGSDFFVVLPAARPDDNYVPQVTCGGTNTILAFDHPDLVALDRTTTQFRVVASAAVTAADRLDVTVQQRS
jgi:hypothetical protein